MSMSMATTRKGKMIYVTVITFLNLYSSKKRYSKLMFVFKNVPQFHTCICKRVLFECILKPEFFTKFKYLNTFYCRFLNKYRLLMSIFTNQLIHYLQQLLSKLLKLSNICMILLSLRTLACLNFLVDNVFKSKFSCWYYLIVLFFLSNISYCTKFLDDNK